MTLDQDGGQPGSTDSEVDLLGTVLSLILRNLRCIIVAGVLGCLLGVAVALLLKNKYTAVSQVVLPQGKDGLASALQIGAAGLALDLPGAGGIDRRFFERVLKSRVIADDLINRFNLRHAYEMEKAKPDDVRDVVESRLTAQAKDGIVRVEYVDTDPERAAAVCNAAVELLREKVLGQQTSKARRRRIFLEDRLAKMRIELAEAEDAKRQFQLNTDSYALQEQAKATLSVMTELLEQFYKESIRVKVVELSSGEAAPALVESRRSIEELQKQIGSLEGLSTSTSAKTTFSGARPSVALTPLRELPRTEMELTRVIRRVVTLERVVLELTREYELARLDEANEVSTLEVLDPAVPPTRKSSPRRTFIVLFCGVLAAILAALRRGQREWYLGLERSAPARAKEFRDHLGPLARLL